MNIDWNNTIWFFDFDDTITNTLEIQTDAADSVYAYCEKQYSEELARGMQKHFIDIYALLFGGYRAKTDEEWDALPGGREAWNTLLQRIESVQPDVLAEYGQIKKWSREVFAKFGTDSLGMDISPVEVEAIADAYWGGIRANTRVYDDALALLQHLRKHKRHIYIATSSDGHLQMNEDGTFGYDPVFSEQKKRSRIEATQQLGIEYDGLSIGDPEDKPHKEFFQKIIDIATEVEGHELDMSQCVMIGDSFGGDLETPLREMGFGLCVLVDRESTQKNLQELEERYVIVSDLRQLVE